MIAWLKQRLIITAFALMGVFLLSFFLMRFLPGDPFLSERDLPKESYLEMRRHWKLDSPWYVQLKDNALAMVQLNLGRSISYPDKNVKDIIAHAFPVSLKLGLFSLGLAVAFGVATAFCAVLWKYGPKAYPFFTTLLISMPSMLVGTLLQYVFAIDLEWLPVARWGSFQQMILPGITLAICPGAFLGKLLYVRIQSELKEPYARFAISKGLSKPAVILKHVIRNASPPALAFLGPLVANIATGTFIVEKIYAIPGLGMWFVNSISSRDYPLMTGLIMFYSITLLVCVFLSDLAAIWADPRQRSRVFLEAPV